MEGDLIKQIHEIRELSEENNKILKSIRRSAKISNFMRILYWLIIIGIGIGSYYYIQPFIQPFVNGYKNVNDARGKFTDIPQSLDNLKNFFQGPTK